MADSFVGRSLRNLVKSRPSSAFVPDDEGNIMRRTVLHRVYRIVRQKIVAVRRPDRERPGHVVHAAGQQGVQCLDQIDRAGGNEGLRASGRETPRIFANRSAASAATFASLTMPDAGLSASPWRTTPRPAVRRAGGDGVGSCALAENRHVVRVPPNAAMLSRTPPAPARDRAGTGCCRSECPG